MTIFYVWTTGRKFPKEALLKRLNITNKKQIKEAFEKLFEVKVERINTEITLKGEKKAFIKLKPEYKAGDVAVKLGIV